MSRVTRLGAGVDASGLLSQAAIAREYEALTTYAQLIGASRVDRAVAVMTSAVRDASNGRDFAAAVTARFGFEVHVLSGEQEAQLTYRGATDDGQHAPAGCQGGSVAAGNGRAPAYAEPDSSGREERLSNRAEARSSNVADEQSSNRADVQSSSRGERRAPTQVDQPSPRRLVAPTLFFDIGGGATEVVIGHGATPDFHVSTQAGVVRQADRHIATDPPTPRELETVGDDVRMVLDAAVPVRWRTHPARAIGVAGTPTSLAAIAQRLDPYDPARVHGYRLSAGERDAIFAQLATMPLSQRQQVPGLHPDRAITILPGIVILTELMRLFALDEVEVSEHDILRGAALHYAEG